MIMKKRILAVLLTGIIAAALPLTAYGAGNDKNTDVPYIALGADLNQQERAKSCGFWALQKKI